MTGATVNEWLLGLAAALAALVAALAPLSGAFKEWLKYRLQMKDAEALKADTARVIPASALQDTMATAALTEAVNDLAAAVREAIKSEREAERDRVAELLEQLVDRLDNDARRPEVARRR